MTFRCDLTMPDGGPCGEEAVRFYTPSDEPIPLRVRCESDKIDLDSMSAWEEISLEEAVVLSVMSR